MSDLQPQAPVGQPQPSAPPQAQGMAPAVAPPPPGAGEEIPKTRDQGTGKLIYHVKQGDQEGITDEDEVLNHLREKGFQPTGKSDDGLTISLMGKDGKPFTVPTQKAIEGLGATVKGVEPRTSSYEHIDKSLRFGVESMPTDETRKAFLEHVFKNRGVKDPVIVGSGSDYHIYHPDTGEYIAITNKPGMDWSDLAEVGARAPGVLGATAGSALAAPGIITGAAGGALGGFAGNRARDMIANEMNPEFGETLHSQPTSKQLMQYAEEVPANFVGGGVQGGLAKYAAGTLAAGPAALAMEKAGPAVSGAGDATSFLAKAAQNPMARGFAVSAIDPIGLGLPGEAAQLLKQGVQKIPSALGKVGGVARKVGEKFRPTYTPVPELGALTEEGASHAGVQGANPLEGFANWAEENASKWGEPVPQQNNLGQQIKSAVTGKEFEPKMMPPNASQVLGRMAGSPNGKAATLGKVIDTAGSLGKAATYPQEAIYNKLTQGIGLAGRGLNAAGSTLENAGAAASGLEMPLYLNAGAQEAWKRARLKQLIQRKMLQDSTQEPDETLVSNP